MIKDTFLQIRSQCVGVTHKISNLVIFGMNVVVYVSRHFVLKLLTERGQAFQVIYTNCTTCFCVESPT